MLTVFQFIFLQQLKKKQKQKQKHKKKPSDSSHNICSKYIIDLSTINNTKRKNN